MIFFKRILATILLLACVTIDTNATPEQKLAATGKKIKESLLKYLSEHEVGVAMAALTATAAATGGWFAVLENKLLKLSSRKKVSPARSALFASGTALSCSPIAFALWTMLNGGTKRNLREKIGYTSFYVFLCGLLGNGVAIPMDSYH